MRDDRNARKLWSDPGCRPKQPRQVQQPMAAVVAIVLGIRIVILVCASCLLVVVIERKHLMQVACQRQAIALDAEDEPENDATA